MTLPTQQQLQQQLEDALNSVLCFCGNHKRIGKPFCFQCWDTLPRHWQPLLLRTDDPHTYDAAKEHVIAQRKLPRTVRKASEIDLPA